MGQSYGNLHPYFPYAAFYDCKRIFCPFCVQKKYRGDSEGKFVQLVVPSVTTYFITGVILVFLRHTPVAEGLKSLLGYCVLSYWFLKALFIFYVLTSVFYLIWKRSRIVAVLFTAALFLLPADILDYSHCVSMFPYFIIGLLLYKYECLFFQNRKLVLVASACVYLVLSYFYHPREYNMYDYLFRWNADYLHLYLIRIIIGTSASFVCIILIRKICLMLTGRKIIDVFAKVGTCTLGIYVFQQNFMVTGKYYFVELVRCINPFRNTAWEFVYFDYIFCFVMAIMITAICTAMVIVLRRTKYLRLILLGEKS